eukprot:6724988-Pyramimonas_sp.AAC.1
MSIRADVGRTATRKILKDGRHPPHLVLGAAWCRARRRSWPPKLIVFAICGKGSLYLRKGKGK